MTTKDNRIEILLGKLNAAEFCKTLNSAIRSRLAKDDDISDLQVPLRKTAEVSSLDTPVATPLASVEGDSDEAAISDDVQSIVGANEPLRKRSKRKSVEATSEEPARIETSASLGDFEVGDSDRSHGRGKRPKRSHNNGLKKNQRILSKPLEDVKNLWGLCMSLRGYKRPQHHIQSQQSRPEQLASLIDNADCRIRDDKANEARHVLEWRCLAMEIAIMYTNMKPNVHDLRKSWTVATGKKPDPKRDLVIDWLTGQLFSSVENIYKLGSVDWRRKKVEYWLRVGCPVLAFRNHCGFAALIAPGMRISQAAFRASKAGDYDTLFVRYLNNTFGDLKDELSSLSTIMELWLATGGAPLQLLKIECLTETDARTQSNLSLGHWAQFANPAEYPSGSLQLTGCNPSAAYSESLDPHKTLPPAAVDTAWLPSHDSTTSAQCANNSTQLCSQTANLTKSDADGNGTMPDSGLPVSSPEMSTIDWNSLLHLED